MSREELQKMQKLTLPEFRDYINTVSYCKFIFNTSNQNWDLIDSSIAGKFEFSTMLITFNPNIIYLKDGKNQLQIKKIKSVVIQDDKVLGDKITFACDDSTYQGGIKEYTLIAQ